MPAPHHTRPVGGGPFYGAFRNLNLNEPPKKLARSLSDAIAAHYISGNNKQGTTAERLLSGELSAEAATRIHELLGPNELATAARSAELRWHADIRTAQSLQKHIADA